MFEKIETTKNPNYSTNFYRENIAIECDFGKYQSCKIAYQKHYVAL